MLEEFIKYIKSLETSIIQLTSAIKENNVKISNLETKVTILEKSGVVTPIDCKTIDWDNSKFIQEFKDNKSIFTLATKNTGNKKVEYKSDFETWTTGKLTFPNTGKCENMWFRVEGCTKEIWGCVTTNTVQSISFITENCK